MLNTTRKILNQVDQKETLKELTMQTFTLMTLFVSFFNVYLIGEFVLKGVYNKNIKNSLL